MIRGQERNHRVTMRNAATGTVIKTMLMTADEYDRWMESNWKALEAWQAHQNKLDELERDKTARRRHRRYSHSQRS